MATYYCNLYAKSKWVLFQVDSKINCLFGVQSSGNKTDDSPKYGLFDPEGDPLGLGLGQAPFEIMESCYADGEGCPKDDQEALKWYQKAVDGGDAHVQGIIDYYNQHHTFF